MALKKFLMAGIVVALLVACGDDDSSGFATRPSEDSSSACEDCDDSSSSKSKSSSSATSSSSSLVGRIPCDINTDEDCFKDERDGQTYRTVKIGSQTWMAENLNYAYLQPTDELDSSSFCYKDSAEYCEKYGRLYQWRAAMDSAGTWSSNGKGCGYGKTCSPTYPVRGICPEGWYLPTRSEWYTLFTALGGQSMANKMLKSTSGWDDYDGENGDGTDAYAFSALPAGLRSYGGDFSNEGNRAYFWSSTENNSYDAYFMNLNYYNYADLYTLYKSFGFSVRCVKDVQAE